ncbi:MAG: YaeQ family protein [Kangiellaceae bacterium]|nr:YaeQ family protein [Kangiellaceae bacterium]
MYKFNVVLSDLNRDFYHNYSLTVALHPSETQERMVARLMAFCINANDELKFTKGLSDVEEPDLWQITLDDQIAVWIDVGEPDAERIKKASRKAKSVLVYSFNSKSDVWWEQSKVKFNQLQAEYFRLDCDGIKALASQLGRTTAMSVLITGQSAFVTTEAGDCEVVWQALNEED